MIRSLFIFENSGTFVGLGILDASRNLCTLVHLRVFHQHFNILRK